MFNLSLYFGGVLRERGRKFPARILPKQKGIKRIRDERSKNSRNNISPSSYRLLARSTVPDPNRMSLHGVFTAECAYVSLFQPRKRVKISISSFSWLSSFIASIQCLDSKAWGNFDAMLNLPRNRGGANVELGQRREKVCYFACCVICGGFFFGQQ